MSQVPNPYNHFSGTPQSTSGLFPQYDQIPANQLPGAVKQDGNLNSGVTMAGVNSQMNHYNQSANSSPSFNNPGMLPPTSLQSSPLRHTTPTNPVHSQSQNISQSVTSAPVSNATPSPSFYPPSIQQRQINNNAPPLITSQYNQPYVNGPPGYSTSSARPLNQYSVPSSSFSPIPTNQSVVTSSYGPVNPSSNQRALSSLPQGSINQPIPHNGPPLSGPRNSPLIPGPPVSGQPISNMSFTGPGSQGLPRNLMNGPSQMGPPTNLPSGPSSLPVGLISQPLQSNGPIPPSNTNYSMSGPQSISNLPPVPMSQPPMMPPQTGISGPPRTNMQNRYPQMPPSNLSQQQMQMGPSSLTQQQMAMPPNNQTHQQMQMPQPHQQMAMAQNNLTPQQQVQMQQNIAKQFPSSRMYGLNQQMGQLSVTKQGFDQLWGHQMIDLLQCRTVLPEYPEDPPEIRLGHHFADSPNCSPEIFRSTINRIPETNSLLQKSRLPLGILIHPFKDLNHLPVIQCTTIVRCRACRTYINPFVYFVDAKRWKCNLCYRVNDLPEEFQYDPVSKSYGDPSRRPEIKSATIEFIAPSEYMLRPPQPAVYLFLLDVSHIARESGYLQVVCDTLMENLEQLPGDARMQIGFICYDEHIHYYLMSDGLTRPKEMTVLDIDDVFLPSPEALLVNVGESGELIRELLTLLPRRYSSPGPPASALGAALQAAYKLMAPTGGRVTVFQTCLPNIGPGALQSREDPNARSSEEVSHLNPATDFYKRLALDCSGAQVAVDLFLLSSQYCDLATLSGVAKFSAGSVFLLPLFRAARTWQADHLRTSFARYLTRKIGFEAVMRVRCTRGISIHTFHGNFFVRSTDLLSLPNVSPDAGFGMQLTIEESLADLQQVCFQAALLYTSSKGERRIRVHTLALPIANTLTDVLHAADQQCIIGLLSKMAADRSAAASLSEAREALTNVAADVLSAHRLANQLPPAGQLQAPISLRLLPLYILALLKRKAFRTGTSTRLDERVMDMCMMKTAPLSQLIRAIYPDLYAIHRFEELDHHTAPTTKDQLDAPDPPRMHLSAERINSNGAYLLDDGETMIIYVCHGVSPGYLSETFGVAAFSQLADEARSVPVLETDGNEQLRAFIDKLNDDRPVPSSILVLRDNSPSRLAFTERLVDDRVESAFSYYEFLQHIKNQVK